MNNDMTRNDWERFLAAFCTILNKSGERWTLFMKESWQGITNGQVVVNVATSYQDPDKFAFHAELAPELKEFKAYKDELENARVAKSKPIDRIVAEVRRRVIVSALPIAATAAGHRAAHIDRKLANQALADKLYEFYPFDKKNERLCGSYVTLDSRYDTVPGIKIEIQDDGVKMEADNLDPELVKDMLRLAGKWLADHPKTEEETE